MDKFSKALIHLKCWRDNKRSFSCGFIAPDFDTEPLSIDIPNINGDSLLQEPKMASLKKAGITFSEFVSADSLVTAHQHLTDSEIITNRPAHTTAQKIVYKHSFCCSFS